MVLPLRSVPRRPARALALARTDVIVGRDRVLTCLRHSAYWLASCQACRRARHATLNTATVHR